jgi:hypothetical protein
MGISNQFKAPLVAYIHTGGKICIKLCLKLPKKVQISVCYSFSIFCVKEPSHAS